MDTSLPVSTFDFFLSVNLRNDNLYFSFYCPNEIVCLPQLVITGLQVIVTLVAQKDNR